MKAIMISCCCIIAAALSYAQAPIISVNPASLSEGLYTGETSTQTLTVSNSGSGILACTTISEPDSAVDAGNMAVKFDGTNDNVGVPNDSSLMLTGTLTIEAWFNFEVGGGIYKPALISKGRTVPNYEVFFDSTLQTRKIGLSMDPVGTIISQSTLVAGTWYHVAFTYDGATIKLYIDGVLDKTQAATGTLSMSSFSLYFARRDNNTGHKFKGELDDVRLWNIARTQEEILQWKNHGLTGEEEGLVGYWNFNESSGNSVYDLSPNNNNGSLNNGAHRVTSGAKITTWMNVSPVTMSVPAGSSSVIDVNYDATNMDGGNYYGRIIIYSNDALHPQVIVPVELGVTPVAHIQLSLTDLEFGNVYIGTEKTLSFIVINSGNGILEVTSIASSGEEFMVDPDTLSIPPGMNDSVYVTYSPSEANTDEALVSLQSNDMDYPLVTVSLSGTGVVPPIINVSPESLDTILYSGKSAVQYFTISNSGGSALEWEIDLENAGYPPVTFTKENYADWTMPENQDRISDNVYITRENNEGIFNIKYESYYSYNTSPFDTEWAYGYTEDLDPGDYQVWRNAVGGYPPGMVNNPISMHLISEDLYFDMLFHSWTSGNSGGGFSYTRTCVQPPWFQVSQYSGTLQPGESIEITGYFDASRIEGGDWNGTIGITSNDPLNELFNVPVTLTVIDAPSIFSVQDTLDFGILYSGYDISRTLQVELSNNGSLDLIVSDVSTSPSVFTGEPDFAGIDPGESEIFYITFTPVALGTYAGEVVFANNDPMWGDFSVFVTGKFLEPPVIHVAPLTLSADLYSGKTTTKHFTISNLGESDLNFEVADYALELDGWEDYVSVGNPDLYNLEEFTLETWIYMYDYRYAGIISLGAASSSRFSLYCDGSYLAFGKDNNNWTIYTSCLTANLWIHVALTYDGSNVRVYKDGILVNMSQMPEPSNFNDSYNLYFGNEIGGSPEFFRGMLDDLTIWEYARSQEQIQESMESYYIGSEAGIVGCWHFNETGGNIAHDASLNENHGSLHGNSKFISQLTMPGWLTVYPAEGTCAPGASTDIAVTFNSSLMEEGSYAGNIVIVSNDPATSAVQVLVSMDVTDAPGIDSDLGVLDFGEIFIGFSDTLDIVIENDGSQDLLIFSAETMPDVYSAFPPYASLDPGETETFTVIFTPNVAGDYPGELVFYCNDPVFEEYVIFLEGTALIPPVISILPGSLEIELDQGESASKPFTIFNTGGSDLTFKITPGESNTNYAMEFTGSSNYIDVGDNIHLENTSFTLEAWVKKNNTGSGFIFGQGYSNTNYGLHVGFRSDDVFTMGFYSNDLNTPSNYTNSEWHHWACTFDAGTKTRKIYRDGIELASDVSWSNFLGSGSFVIGNQPWLNESVRGYLDDVRIWNLSRTQEEIQETMGCEIVGSEQGLIGYWNFDEGNGINVYDSSPNGNHGTFTDGVNWTGSSAPLAPTWLSVSLDSGKIAADASFEINALFNTAGLDPGDYYASITIISNDPVTSLVTIPVHMVVNTIVSNDNPVIQNLKFNIQHFPNPFNDFTTFKYVLDEPGFVNLAICNHLGQQVDLLINGQQGRGEHTVQWFARGLQPGMYYFRITAGEKSATGKIILVR